MNPLLLRQLRERAPDLDATAASAQALLDVVSAIYDEFEKEQRHRGHPPGAIPAEPAAANVRARAATDAALAAQHKLNVSLEQLVQTRTGELAASERLLAEVIESTSDGILVVDEAGRFVRANQRFAEQWQLPAEIASAADGERRLAFVAAQLIDPAGFIARVREIVRSDARVLDELHFKDGRVFERYTYALRAEGGVRGRVFSFRDVTARKRSEAALRESEEKFRRLFDHSPVIMALSTVPDGRIVEVNPAAAIFGISRDEAIGKTSLEIGLWADPAERARYLDLLAKEGAVDGLEAQMRRRDGSLVTVLCRGTLVQIGGRPHNLTILQDITARKESEFARDHLFALTRATLDSTADGILVVDVDGKIITYNRLFAQMWRLPDDVLATHDDARALQHVLDQLAEPEAFVAKVRALYAQPLTESFDTIRFKDGRVFERYSRPQFVNRQPAGRVWSFRDVTARLHTEAQLRANQAQLLEALRIARLGNWEYDVLRDEFLFNDQFYALLRTTADREGGYTMSSARYAARFVHPDDMAVVGAEIGKALAATDPNYSREIDHRVIFGDGEVGFITVHIRIEKDASGRTIRTHGANADITERKRAEQALAQAHRHASVLAQLGRELAEASTPRTAALAILESARQLIGWDSCWIGFWNEERQTLENSVNFDLFDGERREVPSESPAGRPPSVAVRTAIRDGAYLHLRENETDGIADAYTFGTARRSLSRMFVPIRRADRLLGVFSIQSYQRHAYDGAAVELLRALADHCAGALVRIQARAALAETEARFRLVWEHTADGMRLTDADGRVVAANDAYCQMVGKSRAEIEGQPVTAPFAAAEHEPLRARLREHLARRALRTHTQGQLALRDGRVLDVEVNHCVIETDPARPLLLAMFRDVTARLHAERERVKLEETLRHSQKIESLGTLAGGIAHDFNNILTGIIGFVELTRHSLPPQHPAQVWLTQTFSSSQRAKELVRQILTFSRRTEGERKPAQLAPIVGEALRLLRSTLPAGVELTSHFDPACPLVLADANQIHQVVLNLCTNAWHALPPRGGRIVVRLDPCAPPAELARAHPTLGAGPAVRLSVADNGCGMDGAMLPRIFEPFFTTKETGKGTGLGLAVVHGIVGTHGGAIDVRSAPGEGATFELYFPALAAATAAAALAPSHPALPHGHGEHILWIDDDQASCFAVELSLQALGYRVTASRDPAAALEKFRAAPEGFALALTDLAMPGLDGGEVAAQLLAARPTLPVLVMSGLIEPREQAALLQSGVREVLHKPITLEELAHAVARQLAKS